MAGTTRKATAPAVSTVELSEVATMDARLLAEVSGIARSASYTTYSTGSDGFRAVGKASNEHGHRYQISVQLVRIGSKDSPAV